MSEPSADAGRLRAVLQLLAEAAVSLGLLLVWAFVIGILALFAAVENSGTIGSQWAPSLPAAWAYYLGAGPSQGTGLNGETPNLVATWAYYAAAAIWGIGMPCAACLIAVRHQRYIALLLWILSLIAGVYSLLALAQGLLS